MSNNLAGLLWVIICVATGRGYDCGGTSATCHCRSGSTTIDCSASRIESVEHFPIDYRKGKVLNLTDNRIVTYNLRQVRGYQSVLLTKNPLDCSKIIIRKWIKTDCHRIVKNQTSWVNISKVETAIVTENTVLAWTLFGSVLSVVMVAGCYALVSMTKFDRRIGQMDHASSSCWCATLFLILIAIPLWLRQKMGACCSRKA